MDLFRIVNKVRRELYKPLSKMGLIRSASVNYKGLNLKVPVINGIGSGYLVVKDHWMSNCLSIFLQNKRGMVVDIGVNIGLYLVNLRALDANRDYFGFEPNTFCNYYTQELIRSNGFHNVRILPFALSEKRELRAFYLSRTGDKTGSLHNHARFNESRKYSLDVFTMPGDDFFELLSPDEICAFKIDVEGAELEVLRGLKSTLKTFRPYVFCEIWHLPEVNHPTYNEKRARLVKIISLLRKIDYVVLAVDSSNSSTVDEITLAEEFNDIQRRDYILAHKSESDKLRLELAKN
jgi:FkbM family methyltransferase